jgi:purine-binding chemotaxis protein CheW
MTAMRKKIDWDSVRQRLAGYQAHAGDSRCDRDRLVEVFRQRARDLERRKRHDTAQASQVPVVVFRLGDERFGIPLADLSQVLPCVAITPIPGKHALLLGVANLGGTLRSVVDLNALLHTSATHCDDKYIVLLRVADQSLALQIESLDGVSEIDLATLAPVDETASGATINLTRGITDNRIIVLDSTAVIGKVKEQLCGRGS